MERGDVAVEKLFGTAGRGCVGSTQREREQQLTEAPVAADGAATVSVGPERFRGVDRAAGSSLGRGWSDSGEEVTTGLLAGVYEQQQGQGQGLGRPKSETDQIRSEGRSSGRR